MVKRNQRELGARERQIMDAVHQLGEASVTDVLELLPDPPTYSSVRTMLRLLESKGYLKHRQEGMKYIYKSTLPFEREQRTAVQHLISTFFRGATTDAVAALLSADLDNLTSEDLDRLSNLIDNVRRQKDDQG